VRKTLCVALLGLVVVACGDARPAGVSPAATGSFPVTIAATNGAVTIPAKPARIVSLSPTSTEILFAIGAGEQVVAVDDQSNYPATAPKTTLSGYTPNVEAIASYRPDLVMFANDTGGLVASLGKLSITVLLQPAATTIEDTYTQINQLGQATGRIGAAKALVAKMRNDISSIVASAAISGETPTYYHELSSDYFSVTSKTFIGSIYTLLGLRNIADPADKQSNGYPQLSPEFIIQADPDLIFLADTKCCGQTATTVAARPGWNGMTAVKSSGVVELDDDVASRWGPRIVDFLRAVADAVRRAKAA
jgi:iron complex transport system substrate-binding protein